MAFEMTVFPPRTTEYLTKINVRHRNPLVIVRGIKKNPKQYRLLPLPLFASQNLKVRPYCSRHNTYQTQDLEESR